MDEEPVGTVRVIRLSQAAGAREAWDRPLPVLLAWTLVERLFVTSSLQPSSRLRVAVLRLFGAEIGRGVLFRPRTRVKFPWKLHIGDDCWIGEGVWFHNQDHIRVGHDVVISQDTLLTTGSHAVRRDMRLITRPIDIEPGAWITSRCIVLGGRRIGRSALITPGTVVDCDVEDGRILGGRHSGGYRFAAAQQ